MRGLAAAVAAIVMVLTATSGRAAPANSGSFRASVSGDGRFVAFESDASNLVRDDQNGKTDVFVRDRGTSKTERVSVATGSAEANEQSIDPAISADGRSVAFTSWASNLVAGDANEQSDVFVHDRSTGKTELVSVGMGGAPGNDLSTDPSLSADGRYVAFTSYASNLVSGDTAGTWDVFLRDRQSGTTERIDASPAHRRIDSRATISADGRFVAFSSDAAELVPGDTNGTPDVFVHDRLARATERVSVGNGGWQLDGDNGIYGAAISADGRYVTFISNAPDAVAGDDNGLPDIFVRDRVRGTTERIDLATGGAEANNGVCCDQAISADGRYVAFMSFASNLVPADTNDWGDVFVRDRTTGTTERVSVGKAGEANNQSSVFGLSADGSLVVFQSNASNLVPEDVNEASDIFVRDRALARTELISAAPDPQPYGVWATKSPRPPRAGRLYTVTIGVRAGGYPVTEATVSGRATVRRRSLPLVSKSFADSAARVRWRIPKSARNRYMAVTVTVRTAGGAVASTFIAIVR
jgi:Tol biopolymer transport system component